MHKKVIIIADIEGASGTFSYEAGLPFNREWPAACLGMSLDANAVAESLFNEGVQSVIIKDFHRTGYNLIPEFIDPRARVVSGYRRGPVPGIGDPERATALIMIGMHAPSGSPGFLAHTLTSRIVRLEVNSRLISEAELFSCSLAPYGVKPVFFSGCPVACGFAAQAINGISVYPIDRSNHFNASEWRNGLAREAALSLHNLSTEPYNPRGPFSAEITMRDGEKSARRHAAPWGYSFDRDKIYLERETLNELYMDLIRICYLSPFIERMLPAALPIYNLFGYISGKWAHWKIKNQKKKQKPQYSNF